jgi:uncharacterized protein
MELYVLVAVVLAAGFVTGLSGFGFGLVSMGFLPLFMSIRVANPVVSIFSIFLFLAMIAPLRRHVRLDTLLPLLAGAALGMPAGIYGLALLDEVLLKRTLGGFILAYLAYDLLFRERLRVRPHAAWGFVAGVVAGAFSGAFSVSGPIAIMYIGTRHDDKLTLKANIVTYFLVLLVYKLLLMFLGGLITSEVLRYLLVFSLPTAVGMAAGVLLFRHVSSRVFTRVVQGVLLFSALLLLVGA